VRFFLFYNLKFNKLLPAKPKSNQSANAIGRPVQQIKAAAWDKKFLNELCC
jgi:hypothetical protein